MPVIMTPCAGAVQVARTCGGGGEFLTITVSAAGGDGAQAFDGIVTGMSLNLAGNYQFMHTLKDLIYVYAFGDRIGDLTISGLGFLNPCAAPGADVPARMRLFNQYNYFDRLNKKEGVAAPLDITITASGQQNQSINLSGVLIAARIDVVEENGIMGYWSLNFKVVRK